jgi:hypothetical protein
MGRHSDPPPGTVRRHHIGLEPFGYTPEDMLDDHHIAQIRCSTPQMWDTMRGEEVSVTFGSTHLAHIHHSDTGVHVVTWTLSFLGVLAAMIGAWIVLAPSDGTITVNGRTWAANDLARIWDAWLLIVRGGVAAVGMTISALLDWQHDASWSFH